MKIVSFFIGLCFVAIVARLFYWQVIKGREFAKIARQQHLSGNKLMASRGAILASDGSWLAETVDSYLVFAMRNELTESKRVVANKLAPFFAFEDLEEKNKKEMVLNEAMRVEGLLEREDAVWIPLKNSVDVEVKKNIQALDIDGIGFDLKEARIYPEGSQSAHILGFVGKDDEGENKGYFGLEGYYDLTLKGKEGFRQREVSALGIPLLGGNLKDAPAISGTSLVTHIDKRIQVLVEETLKTGIEKYGASAGVVIVINPSNGGVMAMAAYPSYDPKEYFKYNGELFRNPIISDSFEPGSIFKPIVMAAGLNEGVIEPETKCDICDGPVKIDKYEISTWDNKYYPDSSMTDVLVHSDNVGMVYIAQKLGVEKLSKYLQEFGLGSLTDIDLQGEMTPVIRDENSMSVVDLATASFGQGIAVTPIQMVNAIVTIARDGVPIKPQVVDKLIAEGWEEDIKPIEGKRVISKKTANELTEMMVSAAKKGEAKWTALRGFSYAGKTGTAQIPVQGYYDEEKTIASFVGFAPAEKPKFVMLVTLREPQSSQWASETAAPLWFEIAKELFSYFNIQPED